MGAPRGSIPPPETTPKLAALLARDKLEVRYRIDGARASLHHAIKAVWQSCAAGEISFEDAGRRESLLRDEFPPPPAGPICACPDRPLPRPRRRPDLDERRRHARKLAFSGPMPPQLACLFTVAQLAVLDIVAGEVVEKGTCRLTVKEIADRSNTCLRTVQNSIRQARLHGLLVVRHRRLSKRMSLPNIIVVVSKEWLLWLGRRGAWMPSPRMENKGASRFAPQVSKYKKESSNRTSVGEQDRKRDDPRPWSDSDLESDPP